MSQYFLGIYSKDKPFQVEVVQDTLKTIQTYYPDFFPATFEKAQNVFHTIQTPDDFNYDLIPKAYWVEEGVSVRIPIEGENGVELSIVDDRDSTLIPSNVLISWTDKNDLPDFTTVKNLFCGLIETLNPTSACVTEEEMGLRDDIYERSFLVDNTLIPESLCWMTWLGPKHVQNIGEAPIKSIKDTISLEPCGSGYILSLMQEPYQDSNPDHLRFREEIETRLGLTAMYKALQ